MDTGSSVQLWLRHERDAASGAPRRFLVITMPGQIPLLYPVAPSILRRFLRELQMLFGGGLPARTWARQTQVASLHLIHDDGSVLLRRTDPVLGALELSKEEAEIVRDYLSFWLSNWNGPEVLPGLVEEKPDA